MRYITDAKSGNALSALGFGCMRFPRDRALTERLIVRAAEAGVNYFDTAYLYPGSEAALGSILHKYGLRDKVFVATKLPHSNCAEYGDFDKYFKIQLERLKTNHIDYYMIHNVNGLKPWRRLCGMGIEKWVADKKANGLIKQFGFSFHGDRQGFTDLIGAYDWDFCQIQYNYFDENNQAGRTGLQKAHAAGLTVMIMEPLYGGKLATGLPPKAVEALRAADPGLSAAAWAFLWIYGQPEAGVVLSGMNSAEQLEDNLKTVEISKSRAPSDKDAAAYESVLATLRESFKIPCTGCGYCMPCPKGVDIPACFTAYNSSFALGFVAGLSQYLTSTGAMRPDSHGRAVSCVKCGACESKCPQKIGITKALAGVKKRLEPFWIRAALWLALKILR